jgi:hypothetical protein
MPGIAVYHVQEASVRELEMQKEKSRSHGYVEPTCGTVTLYMITKREFDYYYI